MGHDIRLKAGDGHEFDAWLAEPATRPLGGIVVLQEVFGLTEHIRAVTGRFAASGFLAIAPALFDRAQPGIQLAYEDVARGREIMLGLDIDQVITDVAAAVDHVTWAGKVAAVGYCWGGSIADLAACRLPLAAAVSYYGRMTTNWLDEQPQCPAQYHFGGRDPLIPPELVEQIRAGRPDGEFHLYPDAGHGFSCDERSDWHPECAALAAERTASFLQLHLWDQT
ncbi:MAG: dienelactone hydrolase family protein [Chromatiales bacterium]|nr:dienelactone hydrolase family protein [Chromatiales bacterium]